VPGQGAFLRDDLPDEVVAVPPRLDEHDERGGGQARHSNVGPPLPHLPAVLGVVGLLPVLVRVVDDEHVEGLAGEAAFHADGDHAAVVPGDVEPRHARRVPAQGDAEQVIGQGAGVDGGARPVRGDPVAHLPGERRRDVGLE
jgi:hypothetical protein